jgi:signal transduction histidine kinase
VHAVGDKEVLLAGGESEWPSRMRAEHLRILRDIDRALLAGEEPAAIAAAALPLLRDLLGVGRVVVNLFNLTTGEVEWLAAAGRRRVHVGPGVRYSIRFMGDVEELRRGEPQLIDVHTLPPGPEVEALLAAGVHSYAVVPMLAQGELIGAVSFGGGPAAISAEQMGIAQEVAAQFAITLLHARLHERVKRHAEELEQRVRERTAELEAANRDLEAFSYSVSHDLRAPLRAINGFARILVEEHSADLSAEARDYLQLVCDNAVQMGRLVDDLLAFSRLGRQAVRTQSVSPTGLVRRCLEELHAEQKGRRVEIILPDLPACRADPSLLKQVWLNLLANALKYTRKREQATIEVGCRSEEGQRTYFVRDNGVGFDMRYAGKLFGVFQRLHRAEDYEGTGVGLAIVQRIVQRHGGRVWAEAAPDHGATFFFTLPAEDRDDD